MTDVEKQRERDDNVSRIDTLAKARSHGLILGVSRKPERDIEGKHIGLVVHISAKFSGKERMSDINLQWELFQSPPKGAREIIHYCNLKGDRSA